MTHAEMMTSPASLAHLSDGELVESFRQIAIVGREGYTLPLALVREVKAELALREELKRFKLELAQTIVQ